MKIIIIMIIIIIIIIFFSCFVPRKFYEVSMGKENWKRGKKAGVRGNIFKGFCYRGKGERVKQMHERVKGGRGGRVWDEGERSEGKG